MTKRHLTYIDCLRSSGVAVELAQFKEKVISCPACGRDFKRHEEKETDVAIAVKLVELFLRDQCDAAVLVTGDSDIAPAARTALRLFPQKSIYCCFPFNRQSFELKRVARACFKTPRNDTASSSFRIPWFSEMDDG